MVHSSNHSSQASRQFSEETSFSPIYANEETETVEEKVTCIMSPGSKERALGIDFSSGPMTSSSAPLLP